MIEDHSLQESWEAMEPHLDEWGRRLFAASEANSAGRGGVVKAMRATGMARSTIGRGRKELAGAKTSEPGRVRRPGGGRTSLTSKFPQLLADLNRLVDPEARGDPMSPLRWTCKSVRRLACELRGLGYTISHSVVSELLKQLNFSLQANSKTREGESCPDRDAQFNYINACVKAAMSENQPVISVDTKKKELVGDFKNNGREGAGFRHGQVRRYRGLDHSHGVVSAQTMAMARRALPTIPRPQAFWMAEQGERLWWLVLLVGIIWQVTVLVIMARLFRLKVRD